MNLRLKILGKQNFVSACRSSISLLVHQLAYIKKILKRFYMDKTHPLSSPMVVRSLDVKNDLFRPYEKSE